MRRPVSRPPVEDEVGVINVVGAELMFVVGTDVVAVAAGSCNLPQAG